MTLGGLILRVDGALRFVPATVALRVAPAPRVTPVPGAPRELLGIAMHEGTIVPVLAIGPARGQMIVCQHGGELVGLVGGAVVGSGAVDPVEGRHDVVHVDGEPARLLDVAGLYARVQAGSRAPRVED